MTTSGLAGTRTPRQRELISVAAQLFAKNGYHAVGINDISGELGLTGPAFYRHYPSKEALLVAILEDAITAHLEDVIDLARSTTDLHQTLIAMIDHHVDFVFEQSANIQTWRTDLRSLPQPDRHRLRYLQRLFIEEWVRIIQSLRPELEAEVARTMCQAAIALIQSATEYHIRLPREVTGPILAAMAMHALLGTPAASLSPAATNGGKRSRKR